MAEITKEAVSELLAREGYSVARIERIPEGSNHYVFDVLTNDGRTMIAKFAMRRHTEKNIIEENRDTMYGGRLSLEREAYIYGLTRNTAGLPAPQLYGIYSSDDGNYILVEKMSGISHKAYMEKMKFSLDAFLFSMKALGRDLARAQKVRFESFGNIMEGGVIEPEGISNFSDRFLKVMKMHIGMAEKKGALRGRELYEAEAFFAKQFEAYRKVFDFGSSIPVLVFTDLIGTNFFVNDKGVPCGYFDLESSQAAPAALEFYGLRFHLFNIFDGETFLKGEDAFFQGYNDAGGEYAPGNRLDNEIIDLLSGCRLLELTESYWGYIDGLRDTWGERMKKLLFDYMNSGTVDYLTLGDIFRERDRQPRRPT